MLRLHTSLCRFKREEAKFLLRSRKRSKSIGDARKIALSRTTNNLSQLSNFWASKQALAFSSWVQAVFKVYTSLSLMTISLGSMSSKFLNVQLFLFINAFFQLCLHLWRLGGHAWGRKTQTFLPRSQQLQSLHVAWSLIALVPFSEMILFAILSLLLTVVWVVSVLEPCVTLANVFNSQLQNLFWTTWATRLCWMKGFILEETYKRILSLDAVNGRTLNLVSTFSNHDSARHSVLFKFLLVPYRTWKPQCLPLYHHWQPAATGFKNLFWFTSQRRLLPS